MMPQQIPFSLPIRTSFAADDFMITPCNDAAAHMVQSGIHPHLLLLGPTGSGKTHLAHIWKQAAQGQIFSLSTFHVSMPPPASAWLWEDADRTLWNVKNQEDAFHFLNLAREQKLRFLITTTTPVKDWSLTLADLRSRLLALPVATINPLDDALVLGLLLKQFHDRQLRVTEEVMNYLIPRLPRDGAQILDIIDALDKAALSSHRAITIPLVKTVVSDT